MPRDPGHLPTSWRLTSWNGVPPPHAKRADPEDGPLYVTHPRPALGVPLARILQVLPRLVSRLTPRKLVTRMRPLPIAHPGLLRHSRSGECVARSGRRWALQRKGLVKHSEWAAWRSVRITLCP